MKGTIYYGDSHAVVIREGDTKAMLSRMTWSYEGSVTLSGVDQYPSLFDALLEGAMRDEGLKNCLRKIWETS